MFHYSLYINEARITQELKSHLDNTVIRPYESITDDIKEFARQNKIIWISPQSSYAIYSAVDQINKVLITY